ncbi:MAG: ketopantoate reductase family protein [Deltaproteobacteria bacterium]|nr:ketopantoate reductase family protein [Deltaproteobacteria bacterium]
MKICILGAGSLGCAIGGVLTEGGLEVWLMGRRPSEHVEAMRQKGLTLIENGAERIVRVRVATDASEVGAVDLLIVLVKSRSTAEAIECSGPLIGDRTLALSLQNGLGNEEILIERLGRERVLGGRTYAGGNLAGPGRVVIGVKGKVTVVGELDGGVSERVTRIAELLSRAGMETRVSGEIRTVIWSKLLVNVATGAICAITGLPYGRLKQVKEVADCGAAAVAEAIALARADGVPLSCDPQEPWIKAMEGLPFGFKTSMRQDVERGMKTEIDFINGAVVRLGEKLGVPTPVNRTLTALIKGIEFGLGKGSR